MEEQKHSWSDDMRVYLAAERTLLAWIRTGLALMGFGFLVARFGLFLREIAAVRVEGPAHGSPGISLWLGTCLVALGVVVNVLAAWQHVRFVRLLEPNEKGRASFAILVSLILAVLGVATAAYLLTAT